MRKSRLATETPAKPGEWFDGRVRRLELAPKADGRGTLLPIEFDTLPFQPRRIFTIANVPAGCSRGGHGHLVGDQILTCVNGAVRVTVRFKGDEHRIDLSPRTEALLIEAGVWARQDYLADDSVLLVLSNVNYADVRYFEK